MAQPAETALTQERALKHVRVGNLVLLSYAEYASEAAQMETIQSLLLAAYVGQVSLE